MSVLALCGLVASQLSAEDAQKPSETEQGEQEVFAWEAVASAEDASLVKPAPVGAVVPDDLMVYAGAAEGEKVSLRSQFADLNLLVVYRGGWCPFCTRQLSGLGPLARRYGPIGC